MKKKTAFEILTGKHDYIQSNGEKPSEYNEDKIIEAMQEFHDQFIPTPSDLEAMAMDKFPVRINSWSGHDWNEKSRSIFLSGLQAAVKLMGGEE